MRFLFLLFLFLLSVFINFVVPFLRDKQIYINFNLNLKDREIKNLTFNASNLFKRNIYIHLNKIEFSKTLSISGGKIIFINLEKKKSKKKLLKS